jgi:outer membrane protein OmpA-like peptidoglycan-associated protein
LGFLIDFACLRWPMVLVATALPSAAQTLAVPAGGSVTFDESVSDASYALATGTFSAGPEMIREVAGQRSTRVLRYPPGISAGELAQFLRLSIEKAGYSILLDCQDAACGGFDFRYAITVTGPPAMEVRLTDYHFISAEQKGEPDRWVSVLISQTQAAAYAQITEVTGLGPVALPGATPAQLPAIEAAKPQTALAKALAETGRMPLDGLLFDSGRATLAADTSGILQQVADWLAQNAGASIILVGHTDDEGSLESNIAISRQRADAVRQELIARYRADGARISTDGVGFLVPRAPNTTEEGRSMNRRVEIVLR